MRNSDSSFFIYDSSFEFLFSLPTDYRVDRIFKNIWCIISLLVDSELDFFIGVYIYSVKRVV